MTRAERSHVLLVAGARPNFMKIAPLLRELRARPLFAPRLVHTGQHYDAAMSERFFRDLGIPEPDLNLGVGSGSHGAQTAEVLRRGGFKAGDSASDDVVLEHSSRPLADKFQVSAEAMRIRLEELGFLVRKREASLF